MGNASAWVGAALALAVTAAHASDYKRPQWRDDDHDCQNTRVEVLVRDCRTVVLSADGCKVVRAVCTDAYSGAEVATDTPAQSLQIDHVFPAAEAWRRRHWTPAEFADFFNDTGNLAVTRSRTNRQKSDKMPDEWCPESRAAMVTAARKIRYAVSKYGLELAAKEEAGVKAWEGGRCVAMADSKR